MRSRSLALAAVALFALTGCSTDIGPCDMTAATRVVYTTPIYIPPPPPPDPDPSIPGYPMYAGQALVAGACGSGQCHTEGIDPDGRHGAPFGLDFGVGRIDIYFLGETDRELTERVGRAREDVIEHGGEMLDEIEEDRMPPGEAGEAVLRLIPDYDELADFDSEEGHEEIRNWLACGAPIVERYDERPGDVIPIGDIVPVLPASPP